MGSDDVNRLKVNLRLAITRFKTLQAKKSSINQNQRKEIASLLEKGKEETARIRVEHIIRDDFNIEAMEILMLYCELLLARAPLLAQMKHCDVSLSESVNSIIYAAPRCEIPELMIIRDILVKKFGKEFGMNAMENKNNVVNSRIIHKMAVTTPDPLLVNSYLDVIAKAFNVPWESSANTIDEIMKDIKLKPSPLDEDKSRVELDLPEAPSNIPEPESKEADDLPDFDDLARRFEALRKRNQ